MSIEELGRRAVACKRWRWMPGMLLLSLDDDPIRIDGTQDGHPYREEDCGTYFPKAPFVPDLSDPATLGCLLHLVREAWPEDVALVEHYNVVQMDATWAHKWSVQYRRGDEWAVSHGKTEAEALVAALEAAP